MEFLKDLLSQPAVIAGLVALVGLIALKKPATQVITGTVKAMLGMVILSAGATRSPTSRACSSPRST